MVQRTIEDGLAVLALANLEIRGVQRRFDEIALWVEVEQTGRFVADLPPDKERTTQVEALAQRGTLVALQHLA